MVSKVKTQSADYLDSEPCQHSLVPFLKCLLTRHEAQGGITEAAAWA